MKSLRHKGHFPAYATHRTAREEEKPQNTPNTQKSATRSTASVEESTENTDHTEKALHVEKKPQNTQNTLKEGLRKGLPAWRKTTEYTEYTEKGLHVGKNHEILEKLEKGLRKALPAWISRRGAAASLSVVPQSAASPCPSRIPVESRDTPSQKLGLQTMEIPRFNKQLHAIPHPNGEKCQNLQKSPLEIKSTVPHRISEHSHFTFCGGAVCFFQRRRELQLKE